MKDPRKILVIAIIVIILVGFVYTMFYKPSQKSFDIGFPDLGTGDAKKVLGTEQSDLGDENKTLIEKIGELVVLPKNETPSIATITDIEKLKDQTFFARARNEDKVLIYELEKWAVIYRPESNKIVEAASVDVKTTDELSVTPSPAESPVEEGTQSGTQRTVIIKEE